VVRTAFARNDDSDVYECCVYVSYGRRQHNFVLPRYNFGCMRRLQRQVSTWAADRRSLMLVELSASLYLRQNNLFLLVLYFEMIDSKRLARGFVTKTRKRSSEIFRRSLFLLWKSYVPTAENIRNPW
jgi:hypothetical protein